MMEDGVSEDENLVNSMTVSPRKTHKKMKQEDGSYNSNTGTHEGVDADKVEEEEARRGGGFISNLISNLVSPMSPKATSKVDKDEVFNVDMEKSGDTEEGSREVAGDGDVGVFNNLISSIFHSSGKGKGKESEPEVGQGCEDEKEQDKGSSGGIIDNLVSRLPHPLFPGIRFILFLLLLYYILSFVPPRG